MISRHLIRIKALQVLYAHLNDEGRTLKQSERELENSLQKTYDLYHMLLLLPVELSKLAEVKIENARNKKVPTYEDLHPNNKFIENKLIDFIRNNEDLNRYIAERKIGWSNNPEMIKKLLIKLNQSEFFVDYMKSPERSIEEDLNLLVNFYETCIYNNEDIELSLEDESIYWNDDLFVTLNLAIKTSQNLAEKQSYSRKLLRMYRDDEDAEYAVQLLRKTVMNLKIYGELIEAHTNNWDIERIAFMDILIMQMAISECIEFPSIPTKVSMNEYIEISKYYSTDKSSTFINGILDKIIHILKKEGKIIKIGRGLIGE